MRDKMQIAINGWFVNQWTTGSGQYLHGLLDAFTGQATETRFLLLLPFPRQSRGLTHLHARWPHVKLIGVKVPWLGEKLGKLWWEQVAVPLAARRLGADLLWVPYWAAPYWQPCPVVVTVHDVIQLVLPAYRGGRLQQGYTKLVSRTAQHAAAIITVSHAAARDIVQKLHVPPQQIHVVYNGMPTLAAVPDEAMQAAVRQKYGLPERFFLYLGGFDVRKNVRGIIQAYARYLEKGGDPAVRLVIAGQLPQRDSPFTPDPKKIAAEVGLVDQLHFCGYVDESDKAALYTLATAYLFPSLYEGFGLMALEAMQAGTPVITSAPY